MQNKMAFRFRFRPRQLVCLSVCSLLALLCLFRSFTHQQEDSIPSGNVQRAPKALKRTELLNAVIKRPGKTTSESGKQQNQPDIKRVIIPKDDVVKAYQSEPEKMPRIIHITWKTRQIPTWCRDYIRKWKSINPLWQVWFWSDDAADKLVKNKYKESYDVYRGYHSNIQRADAMRYFILYEYGGFYADLDVEPIRSLENLRDQHPCLLSTEPNAHARFCFKEKDVLALIGDRVACNAIMACRRNHAFFKYVIDMLPMVRTDKNPLGSTGPMMLTYRYIAFQYFVTNVIGKSPHRVLEKKSDVFLAPDDWFMPSYDLMQEGNLRKECKQTKLTPNQKEVCDLIGSADYVNGPRASSLTNHHWVHTWIKGANKHKDPSTYDVTLVVPDVIFPEEVLGF